MSTLLVVLPTTKLPTRPGLGQAFYNSLHSTEKVTAPICLLCHINLTLGTIGGSNLQLIVMSSIFLTHRCITLELIISKSGHLKDSLTSNLLLDDSLVSFGCIVLSSVP